MSDPASPEDPAPRERASLRGLFGIAVLIVGLTLYAVLCVEVAILVLPDNLWIELIYYAFTGIVWIFPAMVLIRWSAKDR